MPRRRKKGKRRRRKRRKEILSSHKIKFKILLKLVHTPAERNLDSTGLNTDGFSTTSLRRTTQLIKTL